MPVLKIRKRQLAILVTLLATTGCSSTEPTPVHDFSGTYSLSTIDGHALPWERGCSSNPREFCTFIDGHIAVRSPDIVEIAISFHDVIRHSPTDTVLVGDFSFVTPYTWTRSGNRVRLTSVPHAQVHETFSLTVGEDIVTKVTPNRPSETFLYVRDPESPRASLRVGVDFH